MGVLGSRGFNGTTPVSNDATVNLWAPYWADVKETYNAGYDIINTCGGWLYIVPGANAGYPDRLILLHYMISSMLIISHQVEMPDKVLQSCQLLILKLKVVNSVYGMI